MPSGNGNGNGPGNGNGVGNGMGNCGQNNGNGNNGMDNGFGNGNNDFYSFCKKHDIGFKENFCFPPPRECEKEYRHHYTGRGDHYVCHDHDPNVAVPEPGSFILAGIAIASFIVKRYIFG